MRLKLISISFLSMVLQPVNAQEAKICEDYQFVQENFIAEVQSVDPSQMASNVWLVSSPENSKLKSYLVGTLHTTDQTTLANYEVILPLFAEVEGYISEVEQAERKSFDQYTMGDQNISELFNEDWLSLYKGILDQHQSSFKIFDQMKPWGNFSYLSRPNSRGQTLDQMLLIHSLQQGVYLSGLDTVRELVVQLEKISVSDQLEVLKGVLCNFSLIQKQNQSQIENYRDNKIDQAFTAGFDFHTSSIDLYKTFLNTVVIERNEKFAEKLAKVMTEKSILSGFGFSHLFGDRGVIALLREKGFVVSPVSFSEIEEKAKVISQKAASHMEEKYYPLFVQFINEKTKYSVLASLSSLPKIKFSLQSELQKLVCEGMPCKIVGFNKNGQIHLVYSLVSPVTRDQVKAISSVFQIFLRYVQDISIENDSSSEDSVSLNLKKNEARILKLQFEQWLKTKK